MVNKVKRELGWRCNVGTAFPKKMTLSTATAYSYFVLLSGWVLKWYKSGCRTDQLSLYQRRPNMFLCKIQLWPIPQLIKTYHDSYSLHLHSNSPRRHRRPPGPKHQLELVGLRLARLQPPSLRWLRRNPIPYPRNSPLLQHRALHRVETKAKQRLGQIYRHSAHVCKQNRPSYI